MKSLSGIPSTYVLTKACRLQNLFYFNLHLVTGLVSNKTLSEHTSLSKQNMNNPEEKFEEDLAQNILDIPTEQSNLLLGIDKGEQLSQIWALESDSFWRFLR